MAPLDRDGRASRRVLPLVVALLTALFLSGSSAFAQVTGKVVGTVVDRDTGEPLVGAQVVVEGTNLGEVVQAEGIVATIEREPLIIRDNMISKSRFTGEEARSLPTSSIDQVVELGAGMSSSAGSMSS